MIGQKLVVNLRNEKLTVKVHSINYTEYSEPRYNEPPYSEELKMTNDFLDPSNSKMYGKVPRYNETSL